MTPLARLIAAVEGAHEQPVYRLTEHAVIKAAEDIWFASDDQHLVRVLADAVNGSLDAAVAFKEAMLPGYRIENMSEWDDERLRADGRAWMAQVRQSRAQSGSETRRPGGDCMHAPTPAIALVVAVLKALVAKEVENG
jgi:hypothetical protein